MASPIWLSCSLEPITLSGEFDGHRRDVLQIHLFGHSPRDLFYDSCRLRDYSQSCIGTRPGFGMILVSFAVQTEEALLHDIFCVLSIASFPC